MDTEYRRHDRIQVLRLVTSGMSSNIPKDTGTAAKQAGSVSFSFFMSIPIKPAPDVKREEQATMSEQNMQNQNHQTSTEPTQPDGSGRTFTQEEVNKIVGDRIARYQRSQSNAAAVADDQREQALKARENRLDCREYLADKEYPRELLDALDTSDIDRFKASADKIAALYAKAGNSAHPATSTGSMAYRMTGGSPHAALDTKLANAFRPTPF